MKNTPGKPLLVTLILDTPVASLVPYVEPFGLISSTTKVTTSEVSAYIEQSTVSTVTQITVGEYSYTHPTGSWGPFDDDNGFL